MSDGFGLFRIKSTIITISRINQWDFDWQSFYYPEYLLKIPAGSTITATCIYDNTSNNPDNPNDPPALVFPGQGTTDEMFFIPIEFIPYQQGDENIYLGNEDMLLGDVNGDGTLNVLDVVQLVNMILSGGDISPASDVNNDTILNVLDVVIMVNIVLSKLDYIECADLNNDNMVNVLDVVQLVNLILSNN